MQVARLCPTLCDPRDYTVHGTLQARILEWVAFPFSRGSSHPRDRTQVSSMAGGFFTLRIKIITSSHLGQVCRHLLKRDGQSGEWVEAAQGWVKQGMYREQEDSHLGWPDHAGTTQLLCPPGPLPLRLLLCDPLDPLWLWWGNRRWVYMGLPCFISKLIFWHNH